MTAWALDRWEAVVDWSLSAGNMPVFYFGLLGWYGTLLAASLVEGSR